jgi:predicted RNA-binding Zn-ribbon protein involved in translation (DUF1610 family)
VLEAKKNCEVITVELKNAYLCPNCDCVFDHTETPILTRFVCPKCGNKVNLRLSNILNRDTAEHYIEAI